MNKFTFQFFSLAVFFFLGTTSVKAFSGAGSGISGDPYQITSAAQLNEVRDALSAHYQLANDIDLTEWLTANSPTTGWTPVGTSDANPFQGTFDGNGHVISGLWINLPTTNFVGLFGFLYNASAVIEIKNLGVLIASQGITGQNNVGAVVGYTGYSGTTYSNVTLQSLFVQGNVNGTDHVGAIVGRAQGNITLTNAYAGGGTVTAISRSGGLIGTVERSTTTNITKCYALNTVVTSTESTPGNVLAAGILASAGGSSTDTDPAYVTISSCVAINPAITGLDNPSAVGRIIGWYRASSVVTLENYAYEGALVNGFPVTTNAIGHKNGLNKTAEELTVLSTYDELGWNFTNVWKLGNNTYQYPVLKNISLNKQPGGSGGSSVNTVKTTVKIYYDRQMQTVNIDNEFAGKISIYDTYGRVVLTSNSNAINISNLQSGIYVVKAENTTLKIVR